MQRDEHVRAARAMVDQYGENALKVAQDRAAQAGNNVATASHWREVARLISMMRKGWATKP